MSSTLMPQGRQRYYNNDGTVAAGCLLYTYAAGTLTPKQTTSDAAGLVPNTNPVILDAKGEAVIFWDGVYKVDLKTAMGAQITGWPVDVISTPVTPGTLAANTGAGLVGFLYSVSYAVGSVGKWLKDLSLGTGSAFIGFIQSGADSVLRNVLDKLRDGSVSIADKGGALDSLDNSAALLKALTDGRSVYIPDGEWKVTASTVLPSGAYVWGPGTLYRTNAGPIFTASGASDITVSGIGLKGDENSWAIQLAGCARARVLRNRCRDIMLVETNSLTGVYASTNDSNMSSDVVVDNNTGVCLTTPNAVSQQFIRILYTRDFSVCSNAATGYRDMVLAWGGDYAASGAAGNDRKCYNGLIQGNRATTLAAGIWTAMAKNVRVLGNKLYGSDNAEGLDAEGSVDITFDSNDAINYADGLTVFGLNRNIKFWNNNVTASVSAFRNASSTFYADYGLIEVDGCTFKSTIPGCIVWTTSAAERVRITNSKFENVRFSLSDVAVAEVVFQDNELYYDYVPGANWFVRFGGLETGYTNQPKQSQMIVKRNLIEWRGVGITSYRAFGLTSSNVANFYDIQENTFIGIDEQLSYEGSAGAMTVLAKRNVFDLAASYPSVLHGSSAGMTVIWQDNDRSDGLDAYGINTPASSFFSTGSRIWTNTPTNGNTPGWIRRTGAWGPMANIG